MKSATAAVPTGDDFISFSSYYIFFFLSIMICCLFSFVSFYFEGERGEGEGEGIWWNLFHMRRNSWAQARGTYFKTSNLAIFLCTRFKAS